MPIPSSETELAALFSRLGADDPEGWARSQVNEGIPQLLRFLFLRGAWKSVKRDGDTSWIASEIERADKAPEQPYAGLGLGLKHCLDRGVDPLILTEIVRCAEARMIFRIGYLLGDPRLESEAGLDDVSWGLFQTDSDGQPRGPEIGSLHESVLQLDPTGREMRPSRAVLTAAGRSKDL